MSPPKVKLKNVKTSWIESRRAGWRDVTIGNLVALVALAREKPEDHLKQIYIWKYDRQANAARALVALGASLVVAFIAALLANKVNLGWPFFSGFVGALFILWLGFLRHAALTAITREYVAALGVIGTAEKMQNFVEQYEEAVRRSNE